MPQSWVRNLSFSKKQAESGKQVHISRTENKRWVSFCRRPILEANSIWPTFVISCANNSFPLQQFDSRPWFTKLSPTITIHPTFHGISQNSQTYRLSLRRWTEHESRYMRYGLTCRLVTLTPKCHLLGTNSVLWMTNFKLGWTCLSELRLCLVGEIKFEIFLCAFSISFFEILNILKQMQKVCFQSLSKNWPTLRFLVDKNYL